MSKTVTDIQSYVENEQRKELVRKVREKINALGVEHIYFQFISVTGRVMGKAVPAPHWETIAGKGVQLWYGAVADVCVDRRGEYIGYSANAAELVALPDPETFCQLPWNKKVARVFCTLFRNREEAEAPGAFLTSDCRGNLRRIRRIYCLRWGIEEFGRFVKQGFELEDVRVRNLHALRRLCLLCVLAFWVLERIRHGGGALLKRILALARPQPKAVKFQYYRVLKGLQLYLSAFP